MHTHFLGIKFPALFTSNKIPDFSAVHAPTRKQLSKQAQVAAHLKEHGSITAWEIQTVYKTTDARKMATRLRKAGIIGKTVMEKNTDGSGTHALYMYNNK